MPMPPYPGGAVRDADGAATRRSVVDAQVPAQLGDVPGGLDAVLRELDAPLRVHHHGGPDDAVGELAVQDLVAERTPRLEDLAVDVARQREGQVLVRDELRQPVS